MRTCQALIICSIVLLPMSPAMARTIHVPAGHLRPSGGVAATARAGGGRAPASIEAARWGALKSLYR